MKKIVISLTLALTVLALTALTGCQNLLESPKAAKALTESVGTFTLEIGGVSSGRTILPAAVVQSDFVAYTLVFSAYGKADVTADRTSANRGDPVTLSTGTWMLTVTAYLDSGKTKPAARGSLTGVIIQSGSNTSQSLELKAIVESGTTGLFQWNINYPTTTTSASMTISGSSTQTLYFVREGDGVVVNRDNSDSPLSLNTGYYLVTLNLSDGKHTAVWQEYLHIYQNMTSVFSHTVSADDFTMALRVTSGADGGGERTLRQAIASAVDGDTILIDGEVGTIVLESPLTITRGITIQGNGVTITRAASWTTVDNGSQLLRIGGNSSNTISRVHFKDGRATNGGAIYSSGAVNLESCVFSGNQAGGNGGGAIYTSSGTLTVKGCTFYGNSASYGGAVCVDSGSGTATLTGNLFYGNTAVYNGPVVYAYRSDMVTSGGYNVVDVALGTDRAQSGFAAATGDTTISSQPISAVSFRLLSGRGAANIIATLPGGYPTVDFYGNAIANGAAAGAVQSMASDGGYYLGLSVNDAARGSISATPTPDAEGIVSGAVTVTAAPAAGYTLAYWLKDGVNAGSVNPISLPMTAHTTVQAVFGMVVTDFTDTTDSATTPGTLRYALTNMVDNDIIVFSGVTAGTTTIALESALPQITKSVTIQGNGVTITRAASWTTNTSLLVIQGGSAITVNISRVHFKDGRATGGGAIYSSYGTVNLESCVFSGNQAGGNNGGAIYTSGGTLTVKGCTFYGNSAQLDGGAVYVTGGTVTLTGNLFYGNTAVYNGPVVHRYSSTVTSGGYNVVDVALGTGSSQSGFAAATGDTTISSLPISPVSFRLLSGRGAANIVTTLPGGYPTVDFYGSAITNNAAAGAVQSTASGYFLDLSVNNAARGGISATPSNADGLYSGAVTVTATSAVGYALAYWLQDSANTGNTNPLTLNITAHTSVQAVFGKAVTNFTDTADSATTPGTLRYALTNMVDNDAIVFSGVTAGTTTITLESALPQITKNITIVGNGVTLTRAASWTTSTSLLHIQSSAITVNISRVHFKDGRATSANGGAIYSSGAVNLESCVFSGNQSINAGGNGGGAIYTMGGPLTVKGCTFYWNSAYQGGAVYVYSGTVTLTGNLFYGNTATNSGTVVYRYSGTVTSGGYNVVDVALGTSASQSGFAAATGDTIFSALSISGVPVSPTTFNPVSGLRSVLPAPPPAGFPAVDFYGNTRTFPGAPGAVR